MGLLHVLLTTTILSRAGTPGGVTLNSSTFPDETYSSNVAPVITDNGDGSISIVADTDDGFFTWHQTRTIDTQPDEGESFTWHASAENIPSVNYTFVGMALTLTNGSVVRFGYYYETYKRINVTTFNSSYAFDSHQYSSATYYDAGPYEWFKVERTALGWDFKVSNDNDTWVTVYNYNTDVGVTKFGPFFDFSTTSVGAEELSITFDKLFAWTGWTLTPALSNFTDNLDANPPNALFDSNVAGTLTWDFDTSSTAPTKGAGDIGTGTDTVASGANDIDIDLSSYPGETGYLHLRVTNEGGDSNVLTSQEITTPFEDIITNGGFDTDSDWTKTNATISGGVASLDVQNASSIFQSVTLADGEAYEVTFTVANYSSGGVTVYLGTYSSSDADHARGITGNTTETSILWASTGDFVRFVSSNANAGVTVDDVSVVQQPSNILTNGRFDSDTGWTKAGGATISSDRANLTNGASITQTSLGLTPGATYRLVANAGTGGNDFDVRLGGNASSGTHHADIGGYTDVELVAGSDGDFIVFEVLSGPGTSLLTNAYLKKV